MTSRMGSLLWIAFLLGGICAIEQHRLSADEKPAADLSVEQLTQSVRKSVVVITIAGRDGKQQGLGSGFIVAADGLIATNLHVIGEARPISVQTADGRKYDVTEVHAFDRPLDLALVRIDAKNLPALPIADASQLKQGQSVVALGNPHGLKHSVVAGVVSGTREIDGRQMIQLAMPIEPGNSGGPVVDMQGKVLGIVTMKSAITENLGFAMPATALVPLIEKPNPTPMSRWLTIGALDPREWTALFGARWRQRAGRILVEGLGQGFGGRSLCLAETPPPESPFEVAVTVKLDHEEGAAGLVFCSDGGDVHYGFYPSGGRLRLSRFDGPDVFSWQVLSDVQNRHYRPGDWNTLKVRFEKGKIECFVNGQPAIQSADDKLTGGKLGLAKFRTTQAEFRNFAVAKELAETHVPEEVANRVARLANEVADANAPQGEKLNDLVADGSAGVRLLRDRAAALDKQAAAMRKLAQELHERRIENELVKTLAGDEDTIDLFHAALLVAQLDNDEVDVAGYRAELDRLAREVMGALPQDADAVARRTALNRYLFEESGFHGSRGDYYHKSNSYVNEVLDDREGLPITLSVIYIELARKLGLKIVGVGLPGHFVVRHELSKGESQLIDVYEGGKLLSAEDAEKIVRGAAGRPPRESELAAMPKRAIVVRMLYNLLGLARRSEDSGGMLRYLDAILAIAPESGDARGMRAVLRMQAGRRAQAIEDADWLLEHRPEGIDLNEVERLRRALDRAE